MEAVLMEKTMAKAAMVEAKLIAEKTETTVEITAEEILVRVRCWRFWRMGWMDLKRC